MNTIDIIIYIVLAWAVISGWRSGIVSQVCALIGIFVGIYAASIYGLQAGNFLHISSEYAGPAGFVIVFIATAIAVTIIANVLRKIIHFVGFGLVDNILGVVLSVAKFALIMSLIFSAFDAFNQHAKVVDSKTIAASKHYRTVVNLSNNFAPIEQWAKSQIPALKD